MAETKSVHDWAVDALKERLTDAKAILKEEYKGVRPFRQPHIPDRELLYHYLKLTDQEKMMYAQSFGQTWNQYEQKMQALRSKYNA